ncbi:MAG TPA: aldose epimerase family protein [Candidatus Binatia bacterium]|nr:aldose epimerase family protein [Candidatus Binatia bacterium]
MKSIFVLLVVLVLVVQMLGKVSKQAAGTADGQPVDLYTLQDGKITVKILTYGGIVQSIEAPDRNGKTANIVLGFDGLDGYVQTGNKPYMGAIIGRYANRIAGGTFQLNGKTYHVPKNDGDNALHGGLNGFNKKVWTSTETENGVELKYVSKDGEEGFPGNLTTTVRYTLKGNELRIDYTATTDADTVLNLTNHSYFNLKGQGNGDILGHAMKINAHRYTPVDKNLIPTGELAPVAGTPFDFLEPTAIGARIDADNEQLKLARGYDQNWVLEGDGKKVIVAAEAYEPTTGRVLEVLTDQPGIQFYTGNFLDGSVTGTDGKVYKKRYAFCLETQHYPDSPNHPKFPTTELKPGQTFRSTTVYRFSVR